MDAQPATITATISRRKGRRINLDVAAGEMAAALNAFVGQGRPHSFAWLEHETRISESTLRDYAAGRATPGLPNLLTLASVLPSEFADMVLLPAGLGGVRRLAQGGAAGSLALNARAAELVALIGLHLEDGRIDHREEAEQAPLVLALRSYCDRWLARRQEARAAA